MIIVELGITIWAWTVIVSDGISAKPPKTWLEVNDIFAIGSVRMNPGRADWSLGILLTKVPTIHEADPDGIES